MKKIFITLFLTLLLSCSGAQYRVKNSKRYQTKFNINSKIVDGFNLDSVSKAPLRVVVMAKINLDSNKAFNLLATDIHKWFQGVEKFEWDHSKSNNLNNFGTGSIRTGLYKGDKMIEVIKKWDRPNYYVYNIDLKKSEPFIPIKNHMGIFTVESCEHGGSLITWRQYFDSKIPFAGPIISWIMGDFIAEDAFDNLIHKFGGERVTLI